MSELDPRVLFHDMLNRLASMRSTAELCLLGGQLSGEDTDHLQQIVQEIDHLCELLGKLRAQLRN